MNLLLLPYIFNVLVLVPIGLITLFGGERGGQVACECKFPESAGFRTLLGSIWTAILIGSIVGLFSPVPMSPVLMIQVTYKSLWLLAFVAPRLADERRQQVPWGISLTFVVIVLGYPFVIPWRQLFEG